MAMAAAAAARRAALTRPLQRCSGVLVRDISKVSFKSVPNLFKSVPNLCKSVLNLCKSVSNLLCVSNSSLSSQVEARFPGSSHRFVQMKHFCTPPPPPPAVPPSPPSPADKLAEKVDKVLELLNARTPQVWLFALSVAHR
jgi:hypothetical protein